MKFKIYILSFLLVSSAYAVTNNNIKNNTHYTLSEKEAISLFFNTMSKISKNYYYKGDIDLVAMLTKIQAKTKDKNGLTKQDLYDMFNSSLKFGSGFYTHTQLTKKFGYIINTSSDINIKYIDDILYLKITSLKKEDLQTLKKALNKQDKKIIIDFRDNFYCKKDLMVAFANMLVSDKIILSHRYINYNSKEDAKIYKANKTSTINANADITILTNAKTASTAEAVAHSLKYHKNITIIGQDTAGISNDFIIGILGNTDNSILSNGEFYYKNFLTIDRIGMSPNIIITEDNPKLDKTLIKAIQFLGGK